MLEEIGFYTLSDERARTAYQRSNLERCELLLTRRCNFSCPYCRKVGPSDLSAEQARGVVEYWKSRRCRNYRFSGGEPTLWPGIVDLVGYAYGPDTERVALSTNGSAPIALYENLICAGVNDFSISMDACCASKAEEMSGGVDVLDQVQRAVRFCAARVYTTLGVVLLPGNLDQVRGICEFAYDSGCCDVRLISAAQWDAAIDLVIEDKYLERFPILRYRYENLKKGRNVRGSPCKRCALVRDDMAVCGANHYPCIIYMREGGAPIGSLAGKVHEDRVAWSESHDCQTDPICSKNCLDVCVDYNRKCEAAALAGRVEEGRG